MSADDDKHIGRIIADRYRLDELLGRGGYGAVFRAWDSQFGRDVAIKMLDVSASARTPHQLAQLRERFRREATTAGRINHRCVVTIYDFGVPDSGIAYIVMELLDGHDLAWEIDNRGPLMPDRALRLFGPMLEALGQGHELGIVHKDLKPQNVFIRNAGTDDESMCLVDYGVARVIHEEKLTMTGLIVGTPQYLAPEYITETMVTPKLDVYQIGLILVESLTGVPAIPHHESFIKSCNRHFTGELDIPEELLEGPLGDVLRDALEPNPDKRIADGHALRERLAAIDARSIAFDFQETMKFSPVKLGARERGSLPMNPPIRPEQASIELERRDRDPSVELPVDTPQPGEFATEKMAAPAFEQPVSEPNANEAATAEVQQDASPESNPAIKVPAAGRPVRVPDAQVHQDSHGAPTREPADGPAEVSPAAIAQKPRASVKIDPTEAVSQQDLPAESSPKSGLLIAVAAIAFVVIGGVFFALIVALEDAEAPDAPLPDEAPAIDPAVEGTAGADPAVTPGANGAEGERDRAGEVDRQPDDRALAVDEVVVEPIEAPTEDAPEKSTEKSSATPTKQSPSAKKPPRRERTARKAPAPEPKPDPAPKADTEVLLPADAPPTVETDDSVVKPDTPQKPEKWTP